MCNDIIIKRCIFHVHNLVWQIYFMTFFSFFFFLKCVWGCLWNVYELFFFIENLVLNLFEGFNFYSMKSDVIFWNEIRQENCEIFQISQHKLNTLFKIILFKIMPTVISYFFYVGWKLNDDDFVKFLLFPLYKELWRLDYNEDSIIMEIFLILKKSYWKTDEFAK